LGLARKGPTERRRHSVTVGLFGRIGIVRKELLKGTERHLFALLAGLVPLGEAASE